MKIFSYAPQGRSPADTTTHSVHVCDRWASYDCEDKCHVQTHSDSLKQSLSGRWNIIRGMMTAYDGDRREGYTRSGGHS